MTTKPTTAAQRQLTYNLSDPVTQRRTLAADWDEALTVNRRRDKHAAELQRQAAALPSPLTFGPCPSIGLPAIPARGVTGVYCRGELVGAIYPMLYSGASAYVYNLTHRHLDRGDFTTEAEARAAAERIEHELTEAAVTVAEQALTGGKP